MKYNQNIMKANTNYKRVELLYSIRSVYFHRIDKMLTNPQFGRMKLDANVYQIKLFL